MIFRRDFAPSPWVWWGSGCLRTDGEDFGLIDRQALSVCGASRSVYQGMMDGLKDGVE